MSQTNDEKKKLIESVIASVKSTLEKTYLNSDLEIYQGGLFAMQSFQNGNFSRVGKGKKELVKMQLGFNPKQFICEEKTGLPMKIEDWRVLPLIMLVWQKQPEDDEK